MSATPSTEKSAIELMTEQPPSWLKTDRLIFSVSVGVIFLFTVVTLTLGETARDGLQLISGWILKNLSWFYIAGVSSMFIFLIGIFVSRYGRMKLGDDDEEPEYPLAAWFGMLFAAGVGSILMFWGVAEPMNHAFNVPMNDHEPMSIGAAKEAMAFTAYHFGIHMWVIFALPGLALGYFIYKRKLPPRLSSIFAPLLGGYIYKWPGKLIDAVAIIGTIFGIAVSVGMGVLQINSGMSRLMGVTESNVWRLGIISVIVVIACGSVAVGLDKGIKRLSNLNIALAILLMLFVLVFGPTLTLLRAVSDTVSIYADYLPRLMFWADGFNENPGWQGSWTVFYWAWTVCWAPFIGMFIARISRGRTVREFIAGVIVLPTAFVIIWYSIFGRAGFELEWAEPGRLTKQVVEEGDAAASMFILLEDYPISQIASLLVLIVVALFFITSMDSAAMIMDMFSTGDEDQTPSYYRVMWVVLIGVVCSVIMTIGGETGLQALQEVSIIVGLPFFIIMVVMMYSLLRGMNEDSAARPVVQTRHWEKVINEHTLVEQLENPAPGYDSEGNPLPPIDYSVDEDGTIVIETDVRIAGDVEVDGSLDGNVDGFSDGAADSSSRSESGK